VTFPLLLKQESVEENQEEAEEVNLEVFWLTQAFREQCEVARRAERHRRSLLAKMIANEMPEGLDGGKALIVASR
jgi:hypothetical protein